MSDSQISQIGTKGPLYLQLVVALNPRVKYFASLLSHADNGTVNAQWKKILDEGELRTPSTMQPDQVKALGYSFASMEPVARMALFSQTVPKENFAKQVSSQNYGTPQGPINKSGGEPPDKGGSPHKPEEKPIVKRINKAIKRGVIGRHSKGRTSDEYRELLKEYSEKARFDEWYKEQTALGKTLTENEAQAEFKKNAEMLADAAYELKYYDEIQKLIKIERTKTYEKYSPFLDDAAKEFDKALREAEEIGGDEGKILIREYVTDFCSYFPEKAMAYQESFPEIKDHLIKTGRIQKESPPISSSTSSPTPSPISPPTESDDDDEEPEEPYDEPEENEPEGPDRDGQGDNVNSRGKSSRKDRKRNKKERKRNRFLGRTRSNNLYRGYSDYKWAKRAIKVVTWLSKIPLPVWAVIGAILLILILIIVIFSAIHGDGDDSKNENLVIISKTADKESVDNPPTDAAYLTAPSTSNDITYEISLVSIGKSGLVTITDPIDENAIVVSADNSPTYLDENGSQVTDPSLARTVTWTINAQIEKDPSNSDAPNEGTTTTQPLQNQPYFFDQNLFTNYGFPAPSSPNSIQLTGDSLTKWRIMEPYAVIVSKKIGIDAGIIGMWAWLESNFNTFMENCDKEKNSKCSGQGGHDGSPNTQCFLWGDCWQVGYGNHPAWMINYVKPAFEAMHPGETAQQVGQKVLDESKVSSTTDSISIVSSPFPDEKLDDIISGAKANDLRMRNLLVTLMKDRAIGTYLIGQHFKDISRQNGGNLASSMEKWSSTYYNRQKIVNYIKAVYDAGISGNTGGSITNSTVLRLILRPKQTTKNTYIVNQAFVKDDEKGNTSTGTTTCTGNSTIVIDPGHSGSTTSTTDLTGIIDGQYYNPKETEDMFEVASILKEKLEATGYTTILTKTSALSTVSNRERADVANTSNAALAISIHDDWGSGSFGNWGEVWPQKVNLYRMAKDGTKVFFDNQDVAAKSQEYASNILSARKITEGNNIKLGGFTSRPGLPAGDITLVQLFSKVPWIYNEAGASEKNGLTLEQKEKYAQGIYDGILKSIPLSDDEQASCTNTSSSYQGIANCVFTKVGETEEDPDFFKCQNPDGQIEFTGEYGQRVVELARSQKGKAYVWGACHDDLSQYPPTNGCSNYDCSGLVRWSWYWGSDKKVTMYSTGVDWGEWDRNGVYHSFDSSKYTKFSASQKNRLQPGDAVYFGKDAQHPTHTGIYAGAGTCGQSDCYIHAPRTGEVVKEASLSNRSGFIGFLRPVIK